MDLSTDRKGKRKMSKRVTWPLLSGCPLRWEGEMSKDRVEAKKESDWINWEEPPTNLGNYD